MTSAVVIGLILGGVAAIALGSWRPPASGDASSSGAKTTSAEATSTSDEAAAGCESSQAATSYGVTSLYRAESTTAGEVVAWQEQRHSEVQQVSDLRPVEASSPVLVCIFRGDFVTPGDPPDPSGEARRPHDLVRLLVLENGAVVLDAAGHEGTGNLDPETPSDWRKAEASSP